MPRATNPPPTSRPKKPRRAIIKKVRFAANEWVVAVAKLQGGDFSKAVRKHVLEGRAPDPQQAAALRDYVVAINRWGSLLNQIAYKANADNAVSPQILAALVRLERLIRFEKGLP